MTRKVQIEIVLEVEVDAKFSPEKGAWRTVQVRAIDLDNKPLPYPIVVDLTNFLLSYRSDELAQLYSEQEA